MGSRNRPRQAFEQSNPDMRLHWLQHAPFEGLGSIEDWGRRRQLALTRTLTHGGEPLPASGDIDGLIIMGGPMSANDAAALPWLDAEHRFVETTIRHGKPVLGICLGAQIIARVLGAAVRRNAHYEIGWFPTAWTSAARSSKLFSGMPDSTMAFHWHGETFDIPRHARRVAQSEACENQGFACCDDRVVGLQFHLEMTRSGVLDLISAHPDLPAGPYVQTPAELLGNSEIHDHASALLDDLLDRLFGACGEATASR
jgi:GMP synthase-like glutamine amidotransferase